MSEDCCWSDVVGQTENREVNKSFRMAEREPWVRIVE